LIKKINQERYLIDIDLIEVVPANTYHETEWRNLWVLYCGGKVSESVTASTWDRILDSNSSINGVIATHNSKPIGFITYVIHECTWEIKPVCYVEDLYVNKLYRGRKLNISLRMIKYLVEKLNAGEWSRLYGITQIDNDAARSMYEQFMVGEDYKRYVVKSV
jgi:GNAT superfamily N-acetyltransferase